MSIIDKAIAAVTPPETEGMRARAREKAKSLAEPGTWLALVVSHHELIEAAFATVKAASSHDARRSAQKKLALLLTGHSIAEEAVLYPAMASHGEKGAAELAYQEQSAAKGETAALEELDPMCEDFNDKLEHIRGAVAHHVYEEEGTRFLHLLEKASPETKSRLTRRYKEEFFRYMGDDAGG